MLVEEQYCDHKTSVYSADSKSVKLQHVTFMLSGYQHD